MTIVETLTAERLEAQAFHVKSPVALDFYQASCPPCRVLEPRLERVAQQYVGRLPVYRVDIERDMAVAQRFRVKSIPTVLILCEGKETDRLDGLITDDDLKAAFERAIREARESTLAQLPSRKSANRTVCPTPREAMTLHVR